MNFILWWLIVLAALNINYITITFFTCINKKLCNNLHQITKQYNTIKNERSGHI